MLDEAVDAVDAADDDEKYDDTDVDGGEFVCFRDFLVLAFFN